MSRICACNWYGHVFYECIVRANMSRYRVSTHIATTNMIQYSLAKKLLGITICINRCCGEPIDFAIYIDTDTTCSFVQEKATLYPVRVQIWSLYPGYCTTNKERAMYVVPLVVPSRVETWTELPGYTLDIVQQICIDR